MKFAYSTNAYLKHSLSEAIQSVSMLGYDGIELLCDRPHWFLNKISEKEIEAIQQQIESTGLKISNLNLNTADGFFTERNQQTAFEPALSHLDKAVRQQRIDYTLKGIDLCARLDANALSVTSGLPRGNSKLETQYFIESLRELCNYAEKKNVRIGIEYEPDLLIETGVQVKEVIEKVDSPLLGVNFDIGHSFLMNENPAETIKMLGDRIWNIHIEDIENDTHFHMIPGTGEIPFKDYFHALREIEYTNYVTVELYTFADQPEEAGRQSLAYLRQHFANGK